MRSLHKHLVGKKVGEIVPFEWAPLIRSFTEGDSRIQRQAKTAIDKGERLPLFLAPTLWLPVFESTPENAHLLVDGVPRHKIEGELFHSLLSFYRGTRVDVINLEVPEQISRLRLQQRGEAEGRSDDLTEESIQKRLDWFVTDTLPLLDFFRQNALYRVHDIDGTQGRDDVAQAIKDSVLP
jgi:adenylate kinase family enzyme